MSIGFNTQSIQTVAGIAEAFAVVAGVTLILFGIFALKRYGEMRSMMGQQHSLGGPLLLIICGSALTALPSILPILLSSVFVNQQDDTSSFTFVGPGLLMFIRFLGLCSVIRGIIMLSKTGGYNTQPGQRGKALIHMFAGILLMHVVTVSDVFRSFFL